MKRTFIALFIVTLLVAGTAFGVARWLRCRDGAAPVVDIIRELQLTAAQEAEWVRLETEYQSRLSEICTAHCAARAELADELGRPSPDAGKAAEFCRRMCAAQSASEKLTLEHVLKVRSLLTPEQQKRHAAGVRRQLSGSCPMRVHQR